MDIVSVDKKQPPVRDSAVTAPKRYNGGSERSRLRLRELNFDPIGELVGKYHEIQELIKTELRYQSGELVALRADGKEKKWTPHLLMELYKMQSEIADKLLRYGYGRVPEVNIQEDRKLPPMLIQTTAKGEIYHTSGEDDGD
jgi:hypothetical protein